MKLQNIMALWTHFAHWCKTEEEAAALAIILAVVGLPSSIGFLVNLYNHPSEQQSHTAVPPIARPNPQQDQTEKGNGRQETPVPPLNKAGVFVHSTINSTLGDDLAAALTRNLENLGLSVASDRTDAGCDIEIENLKIDGPRYDTTGRVSWTTTANLNVVIKQVEGVVTKDFPAKATTDDANTSKSAALLQATDSAARYLDNNCQALNPQSR